MLRVRFILLVGLLAAAAVVLSAPTAADDEPQPNAVKPEPPQRVVLRVNRNRDVAGFVELEDDDVIVVRTPRGDVESFPKVRILQIVRLLDISPDEPGGGPRGIVLLTNGQRRTGIILEDSFEQVVIESEGIRSALRREIVDRVMLEPSFEQRYEEFRASLAPGMFERHLVLCRWLVENRRYDLARENLLELLESAEIPEARRLLTLVEAQLQLQEQAAGREARPKDETVEKESNWEPPSEILTREDVNLIRVYEIDFDHPPRVLVSMDTIRKLIANYSANPLIPASQTERNAMLRADSLDIVRLMFELRARELYGEIQVLTEPPSLNQFRQRVHNTWLMNNCAMSGCHGGPNAGGLFLHRRNFRDERVRYTNLLILERLEVDPNWPLINYEQPEMSLIIQYGLPREHARLPHPDVPGWRPAFIRPEDHRLKREAENWIRSMMQPRPQYPVVYEPPRLSKRSEPPTPPDDAER